MDNEMSERDWEQFSDLLDKIVDGPGSWQEKAAAARAHCNETNLTEFSGWFAESSEE